LPRHHSLAEHLPLASGWLILLAAGGVLSACAPDISDAPPAATLAPQPVTVVRSAIRSVVVVSGVIEQDAPIAVKSPVSGTVQAGLPTVGTHVAADQPIARIQADSTRLGVVSAAAGFVGNVTAVDVVDGQSVPIGAPLVEVQPLSYQVVAVLDPALLYRFYGGPPLDIRVQIDQGPAPFECSFLSLGTSSDAGAATDSGAAPVELRCRIPSNIRVFSGIRCVVAATTGIAESALVIPVTAVTGTADTGYVTLLGPSGSQSTVLVKLGLTDGVRVQVLAGLKVGDRILDLPPSLLPGINGAPTYQATS
jgi:macrolide-specific efflux system membrane fusion protein